MIFSRILAVLLVLSARLQAAGLPESALRLFFAQMLRDAFALEASGIYKPFADMYTAQSRQV